MLAILKKGAVIVVELLEVYIPAIALTILFAVFNLAIFFRYVLNDPLRWANEVSLMCFLWAVLFGAAYAWRKKEHVAFTILYDLIPDKGQLLMRLVGNTFIAISLIIVLYPIYDQLAFMQRLSSTTLDIPLSIVYSPILISFILIIGHCITDLYSDTRKLLSSGDDYSETIYSDQYDENEEEAIPTALKE
ncbi:TRAP transporter small permease [Halalkalibacter sp. AB-rgal2]|uniref:TRAP transporter small permease n=1 Tax=Halalkalibacter sp. AB-rgal2 TaxID=3242695 RepID=UPI00359CF023